MQKFSDLVRFVVGLIVMYTIYRLHSMGVFTKIGVLFSGMAFEQRGGFGSVSGIVLDLLPVVVDSVCFIGGIALAFGGFCWKLTAPLFHKLLLLIDAKLETVGIDIYDEENHEPKLETTVGELKVNITRDDVEDWFSSLEETLDSISERLALLEGEDDDVR